MKKTKQVRQSKEQILASLKKNTQFMEKMKFIKDVFYPALTKATSSIDDAQQNLSIISSVIMEKFLALMKEKKMSELKIVDNLSKDDTKYEALKDMLQLFDDYSVFDAKDMLEGMKNEITLFLVEENKARTLDDLKRKWIDEM